MENKLRGLRMITNLHCNQQCNFCYQEKKTNDILPIPTLRKELECYTRKYFEYCTIMGGEASLLDNLCEYISVGSFYSNEVRLTTNGVLLDRQRLEAYKSAGLTGINISIASLEKYGEITGNKLETKEIIKTIELSRFYFPNLRINIALCKENMEGEIKRLVERFVYQMQLNITLCESINAEYSCLQNPKELLDSQIVEDTGYGLIFLEHRGLRYGYYSHKDNYKHTDLVVSPLGTWTNWDGYCHAVGIRKTNGSVD